MGEEQGAQGIAVAGGVGGAAFGGGQAQDHAGRDRGVPLLSRCQFEGDGTAATIDNSMDFCRSTAARATDGLGIGPPFR